MIIISLQGKGWRSTKLEAKIILVGNFPRQLNFPFLYELQYQIVVQIGAQRKCLVLLVRTNRLANSTREGVTLLTLSLSKVGHSDETTDVKLRLKARPARLALRNPFYDSATPRGKLPTG